MSPDENRRGRSVDQAIHIAAHCVLKPEEILKLAREIDDFVANGKVPGLAAVK